MNGIGAQLTVGNLHRAFVELEDFGGAKPLRRGDLQVVHAEVSAKDRQAGATEPSLEVQRIGALHFDCMFYNTVEVEVEDSQGDDDQRDYGDGNSSQESHNCLRGVKFGRRNKHRVYYGACSAVMGNVLIAGKEEVAQ